MSKQAPVFSKMSEDGINNPELDNFGQTFSTPQPAATAAAASAIDDVTYNDNSANTDQYIASSDLRDPHPSNNNNSADIDIDAPSTTTTTGVASRNVSMSP